MHSNISTAGNGSKIDVFKSYMESLKSVAMDFSQIDSRGSEAVGKLIIQKPYKFRLNYYPPHPLIVLGNKSEVVMYDYGLEQTTRISAKENMFNFLLVDSKDWDKNFRTEEIFESEGHIIAKLYNYQTERMISIILKGHPLELRKIIVDEPDGNVIEVFIGEIKQISSTDNGLFLLPNTQIFGKPARLGKKEIEEKYR